MGVVMTDETLDVVRSVSGTWHVVGKDIALAPAKILTKCSRIVKIAKRRQIARTRDALREMATGSRGGRHAVCSECIWRDEIYD